MVVAGFGCCCAKRCCRATKSMRAMAVFLGTGGCGYFLPGPLDHARLVTACDGAGPRLDRLGRGAYGLAASTFAMSSW